MGIVIVAYSICLFLTAFSSSSGYHTLRDVLTENETIVELNEEKFPE